MNNEVVDILIYPVKGLKGISVKESTCLERGLEFDRRYLIVDDNGRFLSQREMPQMALVTTEIYNGNLILSYGGSSIEIVLGTHKNEKIGITIWSHEFESYIVDSKVDDWLSSKLGRTCRFVFMGKDVVRIKSLIKAPGNTELSFADGYPYLLLGSASVQHLNAKVDIDINADRFRPNILINTSEPHIEDEWQDIRIGEAKFRIIKPCARCKVITINQQTGQQGKEPLTTLNTYRKFDNKINFGANSICLTPGIVIRKGDKVSICKK